MGDIRGPFTAAEIKQLASTGELLADSLVRKGNDGNWVIAERISGLSFNRVSSPELASASYTVVSKPNRNTWPLIFSACMVGLVITTVAVFAFVRSSPENSSDTSRTIAHQTPDKILESKFPESKFPIPPTRVPASDTHPHRPAPETSPKNLEPKSNRRDTPQETPSSSPDPIETISLSKILSILRHGERSALKHVHVKMQDNADLTICFRVKDSKYLIGDERKPTLYGEILNGGDWEQPTRLNPEIVTIVKQIENDPIAYAKEHGYKTGRCCFCSRKLTDPKSVDVGYGPVCAEHYGLPWGQR